MNTDVAIVGGGMSGLLAAHVLRSIGASNVIIEPRKLGGSFTAGGLKYIHHNDKVIAMFDKLDIAWSTYIVRGGILLRGKVHPYPSCFTSMEPDQAERIQRDHWTKTRRTQPDEVWAKRSMNDPAALGPRKALRCDFEELIAALSIRADVIEAGVARIDSRRRIVHLDEGEPIKFKHAVLTPPLWAIRRMVDFTLPEPAAMRLNVVNVRPLVDRGMSGWDYVYTPYTPANAIHRISAAAGGYACEINGQLDMAAVQSDLNFIFTEGSLIESRHEGLNGHLLPLAEQPEWPDHIVPLGRFATWNPRATTDVTLEQMERIAARWGYSTTGH